MLVVRFVFVTEGSYFFLFVPAIVLDFVNQGKEDGSLRFTAVGVCVLF